MLQNDVFHGTKNFFLINGTLRSCQTEIFSTPMFFYSLHLINVYSSFLLCTYSISFISIGWLVSIQTNILFRHIRWQTTALILSSSISLTLFPGEYIILFLGWNHTFSFFRLITDLIIQPYTHLLPYLLFFRLFEFFCWQEGIRKTLYVFK